MDTRSLLEQLEDETDGEADSEPWSTIAGRTLLAAASSLHDAAEGLAVQQQRTHLLRRLETPSSRHVLDAGVAAADALARTRAAQQSEQRMLELEAELVAVRQRLQVYNDQTAPVVDFYAGRGTLARVDGVGELDEVEARILAAIKG